VALAARLALDLDLGGEAQVLERNVGGFQLQRVLAAVAPAVQRAVRASNSDVPFW